MLTGMRLRYRLNGGAELSDDPRALADALIKIDRYAKGLPLEVAEEHPATAHLMIINPLHGGGLSSLFSSANR